MKKIIQLSDDRTKAHWKWEWDESVPLSDMFPSYTFDLMVDVTDMDTEPQEGWLYSDGSFTPPPGLSVDELVAKLETVKQAYIDTHYSGPIRETLQALMLDPRVSEGVKATIITVWDWISSVVIYYYSKKTLFVDDGYTWDEADIDFSSLDATDPKVELDKLLLGGA